jgi:hypothetical protein
LGAAAVIAEQAGFVEFTVMDDYFQMEVRGSADEPMLEAYTTLGHMEAAYYAHYQRPAAG